MRCAGLIVAAGRGERFGAGVPKALVSLGGTSLLEHVIGRFVDAGVVEEIVVVAPEDSLEPFAAIAARAAVAARVVAGGARRQDSVRLGLAALADGIDLVAIHDAARPLVPVELIRRAVARAAETGAAAPAVAVTDSLKEVDSRDVVVGAPPRARLRSAQTPQVFRLRVLREAHERALAEGREGTDDVELVSAIGIEVHLVPGEPSNLKITVPEDLRLAEAWLALGR